MCFYVSMPIRLIDSPDGLLCLRSATTSFWHIDAVGAVHPNKSYGAWAGVCAVRCDHRPEMVHPAAHRLIGDQDAAFRQQIFDVARAQREPNIEPDRLLDDFGREPVPLEAYFLHP